MNTYQDNHMNNMPFLSEKGLQMEQHLKALSDQYGYKKLPEELSKSQRAYYMNELDGFWKNGEFINKEIKLTTHDGTILATGVSERGFVCGDYGVFLEIMPDQMVMDNIKVQPGQEYRVNNERYAKNVKYQWFTDKAGDHIKLYFQQKGVTYADYKPGMWYVSPYEVQIELVKEQAREISAKDVKPHSATIFGITEGVICQQVNCCGVMGAGLAKVILEQFPQVKMAFDDYYIKSTNASNKKYKCHYNQLGSFQFVPLDKPFKSIGNLTYDPDYNKDSRLLVANIYSQDFYGNPEKTGKIYTKLDILINSIKTILFTTDLPVYVPMHIGCGYGGEVWERVYPKLCELAKDHDNLYLLDTIMCRIEKISPEKEQEEISEELE